MKRIKTLVILVMFLFSACAVQEAFGDTGDDPASVTTTTPPATTTLPPATTTSPPTTTTPVSETISEEIQLHVKIFDMENIFVLPTGEELIDSFWDIIAETQDDKTINEIIALLMSKNAFVTYFFNTGCMNEWAHDDWVWDGLIEIKSDYFTSFSIIEKVVYTTYTEEFSQMLLFDRYGRGQQFAEDEYGRLFLDSDIAPPAWPGANIYWNNAVIEIINVTDEIIEFIHYSMDSHHAYGYYEGIVVKEHGEWRLKHWVPREISHGYAPDNYIESLNAILEQELFN